MYAPALTHYENVRLPRAAYRRRCVTDLFVFKERPVKYFKNASLNVHSPESSFSSEIFNEIVLSLRLKINSRDLATR